MLDQERIDLLTAWRKAKFDVIEKAQRLNDEAFDLETQANAKRALAKQTYAELNEKVPIDPDPL